MHVNSLSPDGVFSFTITAFTLKNQIYVYSKCSIYLIVSPLQIILHVIVGMSAFKIPKAWKDTLNEKKKEILLSYFSSGLQQEQNYSEKLL